MKKSLFSLIIPPALFVLAVVASAPVNVKAQSIPDRTNVYGQYSLVETPSMSKVVVTDEESGEQIATYSSTFNIKMTAFEQHLKFGLNDRYTPVVFGPVWVYKNGVHSSTGFYRITTSYSQPAGTTLSSDGRYFILAPGKSAIVPVTFSFTVHNPGTDVFGMRLYGVGSIDTKGSYHFMSEQNWVTIGVGNDFTNQTGIDIQANPPTVNSGINTKINFTFPPNTLHSLLYLSCAEGLSTNVTPEICNTFIDVTSNKDWSPMFFNSTSQSKTVIANYYVYTAGTNNYQQASTNIVISSNPHLTLTSPNGGERLAFNSKVTIKWNAEKMPTDGRLRVALINDKGFLYDNLVSKNGNQCIFQEGEYGRTGPCIDVNAGSAEIYIPATATSQYKLEISCFTPTQSYCVTSGTNRDTSDGLFYIAASSTGPLPALKIVYPNGGEFIKPGKTSLVKWQNIGLSSSDLIRFTASSVPAGFSVVIGDRLYNTDFYGWEVHPQFPIGKYKIEGCVLLTPETGCGSISDSTDAVFTVSASSTPPTPATITISTRIDGRILTQSEAGSACTTNLKTPIGNNTAGCVRTVNSVGPGTYSVSWYSGYPVGANTSKPPTITPAQTITDNSVNFYLDFEKAPTPPPVTPTPTTPQPMVSTPPSLSSLSLTSCTQGSTNCRIEIRGSNFTSGGNSVKLGGTSIGVNNSNQGQLTSNGSSLVVDIPSNTTAGSYSVIVSNAKGTSNSLTFTVAPASSLPIITSVSPSSGPKGTVVTLIGSNFDSSSAYDIQFGNLTLNGTLIDSSHVTFTVPAQYTYTPGTVYQIYIVNDYGESAPANFTVTAKDAGSNDSSYAPGSFIAAIFEGIGMWFSR